MIQPSPSVQRFGHESAVRGPKLGLLPGGRLPRTGMSQWFYETHRNAGPMYDGPVPTGCALGRLSDISVERARRSVRQVSKLLRSTIWRSESCCRRANSRRRRQALIPSGAVLGRAGRSTTRSRRVARLNSFVEPWCIPLFPPAVSPSLIESRPWTWSQHSRTNAQVFESLHPWSRPFHRP